MLQWVATCCRPDIQFATQRVQRCTKVTTGAVTAANRILAFLRGTIEQGIADSPQLEENFRNKYS